MLYAFINSTIAWFLHFVTPRQLILCSELSVYSNIWLLETCAFFHFVMIMVCNLVWSAISVYQRAKWRLRLIFAWVYFCVLACARKLARSCCGRRHLCCCCCTQPRVCSGITRCFIFIVILYVVLFSLRFSISSTNTLLPSTTSIYDLYNLQCTG